MPPGPLPLRFLPPSGGGDHSAGPIAADTGKGVSKTVYGMIIDDHI